MLDSIYERRDFKRKTGFGNSLECSGFRSSFGLARTQIKKSVGDPTSTRD